MRLVEHSIILPLADAVQVESTLHAHEMTDTAWLTAVLSALELCLILAEVQSPRLRVERARLEAIQVTVVLAEI